MEAGVRQGAEEEILLPSAAFQEVDPNPVRQDPDGVGLADLKQEEERYGQPDDSQEESSSDGCGCRPDPDPAIRRSHHPPSSRAAGQESSYKPNRRIFFHSVTRLQPRSSDALPRCPLVFFRASWIRRRSGSGEASGVRMSTGAGDRRAAGKSDSRMMSPETVTN